MPSSYGQSIHEGSLELETSALAAQIDRGESLPFEATAMVLSRVATHADHVRNAPTRELELAKELYGYAWIWPKLEVKRLYHWTYSLSRRRDSNP